MNILSFNNGFANNNTFSDRDVLSAFKQEPDQHQEIKQGMSSQQIADIVSDRLIEVVREQFETVKKKFQAKAKK